MSIKLHTERLLIREFTPTDEAGVFAIVGDTRITQFLSFDARTATQTHAMLTGILERQHADPRTEYYLAVTPDIDSTDVIGFARLGLGGHQAADLGYAIRHDHQGKGFAREAAAAMLDFGFHKLGIHRITAHIAPDNTASLRLVRSLGFTLEGTVRDHVFTNGTWRDSASYSLLAHEWASAPCAHCGKRMPPTRRNGRSRQFCSSACRQAAYRTRRALSR